MFATYSPADIQEVPNDNNKDWVKLSFIYKMTICKIINNTCHTITCDLLFKRMTIKHMSSRHTPKMWGVKKADMKEKTVYIINECTYIHKHALPYTYTHTHTHPYTCTCEYIHIPTYTYNKVGIMGGGGFSWFMNYTYVVTEIEITPTKLKHSVRNFRINTAISKMSNQIRIEKRPFEMSQILQ